MTYYLFDQTGLFVGTSDIWVERSTTIEPLPTPGYLAYWNGLDWSYVRVQDVISRPPPAVASRRITKFAFRNRFTQTEKENIELSMLDVPTGQPSARRAAARLRAYDRDIAVATFVDLDRPDTRNGVLGLEAAGLIEAGRAAQILDSPVTNDEVFND